MNKKLVVSLAAVGVLAGGTTAGVLAATSGAAGAAATPGTLSSASPSMPCTGDALRSLVRKGTITQAQATAFQNALWAYMDGHHGRMINHMDDMPDHMGRTPMSLRADGPMRTVLRQLVSKGTITQAQATAISNAITQEMRDHWTSGAGMHGTHAGNGHGLHGTQSGKMSGTHMGMN